MRSLWEQMTKGQQRTVIVGLVFAVAVLFVQFAVFPYLDARHKVKGAIAGSEKTLRELAGLGGEFTVLRERQAEIRRAIERRPPDFNLFSDLERRAAEAGVKTNIRSITPLKTIAVGPYEEASVEIRLNKMTMRQLTDFLYKMESREDAVRIRRMSVEKTREDPGYLNVQIQAHTYLPPSARTR